MGKRIAAASCVLALACAEGGGVVSIDDSTGAVVAVAYLDRDGDGVQGDGDPPVAGIRTALVQGTGGDTVAAGSTAADGSVVLGRIPVGRYRLVATRGSVGDSVAVLGIDEEEVTVALGDTAAREIRVGYPAVTIAEARSLEAGRRAVVEGIALNAWTAFGDSTVHLMDATGSIRAVQVLNAVASGDSVRLHGTIAMRNGQPVVAAARATTIQPGAGRPVPDSLSTAVAATAAGGARDAGQALIRGNIVGSQPQANGDLLLLVNDGSGSLGVLIDASLGMGGGGLAPGAELRAAGVLVPTGTGSWQLKPRAASEVSATYPTVSVSEARALPAGTVVYVHGVALNAWVTFGDGSVHMKDVDDAVRIIDLPASQVFMGDSIRVLATTGVRNGQPVLDGMELIVLLSDVGVAAPDSVTTAAAAAAAGGRDADQVAVSGTVTAVTPVTGATQLTIDDGTGPLNVVLDNDVGFSAGDYALDDEIRVRGVLVAAGAGVWQLKPRSLGEVAAN